MVYTKGSEWHLLFILKPKLHNIHYLTVVCGLIHYLTVVWSNLLKKTAVTTTNYLAAEKESVCIRKNR